MIELYHYGAINTDKLELFKLVAEDMFECKIEVKDIPGKNGYGTKGVIQILFVDPFDEVVARLKDDKYMDTYCKHVNSCVEEYNKGDRVNDIWNKIGR